jgi:hypothetical protein
MESENLIFQFSLLLLLFKVRSLVKKKNAVVFKIKDVVGEYLNLNIILFDVSAVVRVFKLKIL